MKIGLKLALAALLFVNLAMGQFKEDCASGSDSDCKGERPFCCSMKNLKTNSEIKMCMSKNMVSDEKIVGQVKDVDDEAGGQPVWKYICPTMVDRCTSLNDCTKEGQDHNGFCCQTAITKPAGHTDKINSCVPKYNEFDSNDDLQKKPIGQFDKKIKYKKDDGGEATTGAGELTYTYSCPSMLGDCEVFKITDGKYVLDDQGQSKTFEDEYACGKGSLTEQTHCCSMQSTDPKLDGQIKMCMKHDAGTSPFGTWKYEQDGKNMGFTYTCPSLAANCKGDDTCDAASKEPFCCNLEATNPGIKGETKRCLANPGNITGLWTYKEKDVSNKIDYKFKCPANVLQNCTGDTERDCFYKQPFCCRLKNTDYKWKKDAAGTSDFQMCMDTPWKGAKKLKDKWEDPTNAAVFDYDCPETTFDLAASAYDEFFDYAIDFKQGNNPKLKKAGLKYPQCEKNADCPPLIKNSTSCCVESVMSLGDWDMEGNLVNMKNSTVFRCMKEQIPDSQIFTEIDDYYVSMKCTESTFASHLSLTLLASLALAFATILF